MRLLAYTLFAAALAAFAVPAGAHIVYARATLAQLAEQSELVVLAEFRSGPKRWAAEDGGARAEYYEIAVVETLKGAPGGAHLEWTPHAEGFPSYASGDRALLFLHRTAGHHEAESAGARFAWFSAQGPGQEWKLAGAEAEPILAAARGYASGAGRADMLAKAIASGVARLETDALTELVRSGGALFADPAAAAQFAALARSPDVRLMVRLPLACLVDGHAGFEVAPFLLAMAREPLTPPERALLVQIAGTVRDERFTAWLTTELASPHRMTRLAATRSLGHPWHAPAVPALAPLTSASDLGLARAALDSLAAIGTPEARNVLRNAIASTADLKRRTWAEAALRRTEPDAEPDQEVAPRSATPSATRSVLLEF